MSRFVSRAFISALLLSQLFTAFPAAAQKLTITPTVATGIYAPGEKVAWSVAVDPSDPAPGAVGTVHYKIQQAGNTVVAEGDLDLSKGAGMVAYQPAAADSYLLSIKTIVQEKTTTFFGGAVAEPSKIGPSAPRPVDFDEFWNKKIAALRAVPPNPIVTPGDSGIQGIAYETVVLDNIEGAHVHAQIAYPQNGTRLPAIIVMQWAGVYPLQKAWATNQAKQGWLAVNVMAHDLPIDQPKAFYDDLLATTLKDYVSIGNDDRDKSYFLKMILGDVRIADYVASRPEWDGKTMVASGTSQGGFQTLALTGLHPRITAALALVPAGCDQTAPLAGRAISWPYWLSRVQNGNDAKLKEACRYFDGVNFAHNIRVPLMIGAGWIDQTSRPTGVLAAFNQATGPKELVPLPLSDHQGHGNSQAPYYPRQQAWLSALKTGTTLDVRNALK
ncbi:MAG TPA: acetylxylan esterase [Capsulimonadaceae bacterium]|jgi:cephalosporin-C deacetylase-like acetyl esterase